MSIVASRVFQALFFFVAFLVLTDAAHSQDVRVKEEHGDWQVRCAAEAGGGKLCVLYQLLVDGNGNTVAEITIRGPLSEQDLGARAILTTPLETLLTKQLTLRIGRAEPKRYPFTFCSKEGCFVTVALTEHDIGSMRAAAKAQVTIIPAAAPDREVVLAVSLQGFTAGYAAIVAANSDPAR